MTEFITSRANPLCAKIKKLNGSGAFRREEGLFVGEGPKLLAEAVKAGWPLECVVTRQGMKVSVPDGVRRVEVPGDLLASLCDTKTPQGVLSICGMPSAKLPGKLEGKRYVVLDGVQDPGNVGTILRTADAFSADGMLLVNACADLYNPKTVRATMGAVFRCPVWTCDVGALRELLTGSGLPLYGAALRSDTVDARTADYSRCAVAIGSEGKGLSQAMLEVCDQTVLIPMQAHCESLNAAVAATVLLWEAARND